MENYLKTKDDMLGYVKLLIRHMNVDGRAALKEIGFIRAKVKLNNIPSEIYDKAQEDIKNKDLSIPRFSSKEAAIYAMMDVIELSLADSKLTKEETEEIDGFLNELNLEMDSETKAAVDEYIEKYLDSNSAFEKDLGKIISPMEVSSLDTIFKEDSEKISFAKVMSRVAFADGSQSFTEEMLGKMVGGGVFKLSHDMVLKVIEEMKSGDISISFESNLAKRAAVSCSIRMAGADGDFSDVEKAAVLKVIEDLGLDISKDLIDNLVIKANARREALKLRNVAFKTWLEK